jgi:hypothetical protein
MRKRDGRPATANEWQRRPWLSSALRMAIFCGPVVASFAIATVLSDVLPRPGSRPTTVLWLVVVMGASVGAMLLFQRVARRLLPLAALLNVSLLFPDRAPARFAVVRRTGSPTDLRARLEAARARGDHDQAHAMQSVVELVLALSVHDKATRGHSERVRVFTDLIADELKLDDGARARLRWAALLHDIGKLEIPTTLLNKADKPTAQEWATLHAHPEEGARLAASLLPWLGDWGRAVAEHHERYDGTGYPRRLKGNAISLAARIVAVADSYEVMTAPRPYKRAMSVSAARRELTRVAGSQLDPAIVRAFLNISVGRLWRTIGVGAWVGQVPTVARVLSGFGRFGTLAGSAAASVSAATLVTAAGLGGPGVARAAQAPAAATTVPTATSLPVGTLSPGGSGVSSSVAGPPSKGGGKPSDAGKPSPHPTAGTAERAHPSGAPAATATSQPVTSASAPTAAATAIAKPTAHATAPAHAAH